MSKSTPADWRASIHPIPAFAPLGVFVLPLAALLAAVGAPASYVGGFVAVTGVPLALYGLSWFLATRLTVTESTVEVRRGLIRRKRLSIPLSEVAAVTVEQHRSGARFGYGAVVVTGAMKVKAGVSGVVDPFDAKKVIEERADRAQPARTRR